MVVTAVEPNGIVRGTFTCTRTKWTAAMGETKDKNSVRATLTGSRLLMEIADGGGFDVIVAGRRMDGYGKPRSGMAGAQNPVSYLKQ